MTKQVNAQNKRGGRYKNEFSFHYRKVLPQRRAPIKTALLIDNQAAKTADNDIQLVLQVNPDGQMQVLAETF